MNSDRVVQDAAAPDSPDLSSEGVVRGLAATEESGRRVLRFVVESDGRSLPVEMRGEEVRGVLSEGDRVRLADAPVRDGTVLATRLTNLTTGAQVEMWRPTKRVRVARLGGALAKTIASAVVTGLVGVAIGAIFVSGKSGRHSNNPPPGRANDLALVLSVGLCIALALCAVILWRRRRSRRSVAVLVGALIGVVAAVIVVALAV